MKLAVTTVPVTARVAGSSVLVCVFVAWSTGLVEVTAGAAGMSDRVSIDRVF